jgi:hypothetical protein
VCKRSCSVQVEVIERGRKEERRRQIKAGERRLNSWEARSQDHTAALSCVGNRQKRAARENQSQDVAAAQENQKFWKAALEMPEAVVRRACAQMKGSGTGVGSVRENQTGATHEHQG